jgi:hypothetical protein
VPVGKKESVVWRRHSPTGDCVEVAGVDGHVWVRDSKDPDSPVLSFTPTEWQHFLDGVDAGDFTLGEILGQI